MKVFLSYSHVDSAWKDRLLRHLIVAIDRGSLSAWDDTRIPPGTEWEAEIERAMREADAAILLLSADFLSSQYIREREIPTLLQRHREHGLRMIPVLARPCPWRTVSWLRDLQLFPSGSEALSGLTESRVEAELARLTENLVVSDDPSSREGTEASLESSAS